MADNDKKPVINLVPAILTGTAALLAALTTVYVNVRNDLKSDSAATAVAAAPAQVVAPAREPAQPQALRLQLQRIAVHEDGAVGSADWRFAIEADGQPLFALERESLSSQGGRNILVVGEDRDTQAGLELAPGKRIPVTVKGWRGGWFKNASEPLVQGQGWLTSAGTLAPIAVKATDERKGAFTFYFSATVQGD